MKALEESVLMRAVEVLEAATRYAFCVPFERFRQDLFPDHADNVIYVRSKYKLMQTSLTRFFSQLDQSYRVVFAEAVLRWQEDRRPDWKSMRLKGA
jgi:hypothetical protein